LHVLTEIYQASSENIQYVISNAVSSIVIAKAKPEAIHWHIMYGLLHSVRNDGKENLKDLQYVEVLFSEEIYS
jgi:hypothetical protein